MAGGCYGKGKEDGAAVCRSADDRSGGRLCGGRLRQFLHYGEGTEGTASYFVSPLAQKALFEESEIFDDLFAGDVRDVTRMRSSAASWRRTEATTGRKGSISRNM